MINLCLLISCYTFMTSHDPLMLASAGLGLASSAVYLSIK